MKCPKCDFDNKEGRKFCSKCGAKLENACSKCGFRNDPDDAFCGGCGAKLAEAIPSATDVAAPKLEDMQKQLQNRIPQSLADRLFAGAKQMQGEYRLVTAIFVDVVGSSTMARKMPLDQYVDTMNECFKMMVDTISIKYEGSINRFIGDCVLAFFGAPITHENDAERAILAALDIRDAVKDLKLNVSIGINTGMTYVGEMGSDLYFERSAWGPDVDFAKRLQEAANPGEVWVGAPTYRLTSRIFDFEVPIDIEVKGAEGRQIAYPVVRTREHPEKLRGIEGLRPGMIGREREFADLKEAADNLISGRGSIASIIGEAGLGKSRLALELKEYLKDKNVNRYEGISISIGQTVSYWPFLDILRTYLNLSDADSESEVARKLRESIMELFPSSWDDILPFLGRLLSIKFGDELDNRLAYFTPEQIRHQTLMRLKGLFIAISHRKPLLLILEDLHWSDDLSLDLISLLMDELAENPLMLLCIYRPEREHRCWQISDVASRKCLDRYTEITLKKLSAVQSRQLVESLLSIENLPETTKGMILKKSEGNPFFIEEVIRSLMEQDLVYREGDRWKARREIEDIDVPDTIQSVLLARVDRLEAESKYVLQCASVIGRLFRYRLLEHLARHEKDLEEHLSQLQERDLVYEERSVPELEYAFKHVLTQEATYQGILERRRKEFHQRVAHGIENFYEERIEEFYEELAYHHKFGGNDEKAMEYLIKAGHKARRLYNNAAAIDYYTDALEKMGTLALGDRRDDIFQMQIEVYEGLADVYRVTSKFDAALESYEKALEKTQDLRLKTQDVGNKQSWVLGLGSSLSIPESKAAIYRKMGDIYEKKGDYDASKEQYSKGLAELKDYPSSIELPRLYNSIGFIYYRRGEYSETIKMCEQALEILALGDTRDDYITVAETYKNLAIAKYLMGNAEEAFVNMDLSAEMAEKTGNRMLLAGIYNTKATIYQRSGNPDDAIRTLQRVLEMQVNLGDINGQASAKLNLAIAHRIKGEYNKTIAYLEDGLEMAQRVGNVRMEADAYNNLGVLYHFTKEFDKAIECYQKCLEIHKGIGFARGIACCAGNIAEVYRQKGDLEEAEKCYMEALEIAEQINDQQVQCYQYHGLGETYLARENYTTALERLERALELAKELNDREAMGHACRSICSVYQKTDRLEEALSFLDQASDYYAEMGAETKLKELQELKAKLILS